MLGSNAMWRIIIEQDRSDSLVKRQELLSVRVFPIWDVCHANGFVALGYDDPKSPGHGQIGRMSKVGPGDYVVIQLKGKGIVAIAQATKSYQKVVDDVFLKGSPGLMSHRVSVEWLRVFSPQNLKKTSMLSHYRDAFLQLKAPQDRTVVKAWLK